MGKKGVVNVKEKIEKEKFMGITIKGEFSGVLKFNQPVEVVPEPRLDSRKGSERRTREIKGKG